MNNLTKRVISAVVYVSLIMGAAWLGVWSFFAVFLFFQVLCLMEFYKLVKGTGAFPYTLYGIVTSVLFFISSAFHLLGISGSVIYFLPAALIYIILISSLYSKRPYSLANAGYTLLGIFYLSFPFVCFNYIAFYPNHCYSFHIPVGYFLLIWVYDTGAYFSGSLFGKRKLFRSISPNKTWEGFWGGGILCILSSIIIANFVKDLQQTEWTVIALLVIVAGTYGDLFKSLLKRSINVKDSGNIMPGHGGILDRMDSFLFSAPFVLMYLFLIPWERVLLYIY